MRKLGSIFAVFCAVAMLGAFANRANAAIDEAAANKCSTCHEDVVKGFLKGTHHGKALSAKAGSFSCESCHGSAEKHISDNSKDSIISFKKDSKNTAEEKQNMCLSCHSKTKDLMAWSSGPHKKNDVACSSCHTIHESSGKGVAAETCFSCHKDIKTMVNKQSHHPIIEGKVSCNDCHNPHGNMGHGNLRADNNNQLCYKCHADKRGPFAWEHTPVEENCLICHNPHGSQHESMLTRKPNQICGDCHGGHGSSGAPFSGAEYYFGGASKSKYVAARSCVNCHSRLHGSNAPANPNATNASGNYFTR